ncbi:hypothetical protein OG563_07175 [Nocardia vinacea]|uniref:Uncharacterized protein n=1 Tax=Nocardia vinacea TaxID=96468 RepID=A0ABZ1YXH4_9NOCA|nr:hypothetical protein [Nocardia vinacea]
MSTDEPDPNVPAATDPRAGVPRRTVIVAASTTAVVGAALAGGVVGGPHWLGSDEPEAAPPKSVVSLVINGERHTVTVDNFSTWTPLGQLRANSAARSPAGHSPRPTSSIGIANGRNDFRYVRDESGSI